MVPLPDREIGKEGNSVEKKSKYNAIKEMIVASSLSHFSRVEYANSFSKAGRIWKK